MCSIRVFKGGGRVRARGGVLSSALWSQLLFGHIYVGLLRRMACCYLIFSTLSKPLCWYRAEHSTWALDDVTGKATGKWQVRWRPGEGGVFMHYTSLHFTTFAGVLFSRMHDRVVCVRIHNAWLGVRLPMNDWGRFKHRRISLSLTDRKYLTGVRGWEEGGDVTILWLIIIFKFLMD